VATQIETEVGSQKHSGREFGGRKKGRIRKKDDEKNTSLKDTCQKKAKNYEGNEAHMRKNS